MSRKYFEKIKDKDMLDAADLNEAIAEGREERQSAFNLGLQNDLAKKKLSEEEVDVDINIVSYAPKVFRFIRAIDGIKEQDIIDSVTPHKNRLQIFKVNTKEKHQSGGKSGSFFFLTENKKFIIKTMS